MFDLVLSDTKSASPNMDHLCFRIEPFDRAAIEARLGRSASRSAKPSNATARRAPGPSVYFHDPEGNQIELKGPPA